MAKQRPVMPKPPGSVYPQNGRYWWKVQLPGEAKPKARSLKPQGARFATRDFDLAVTIANNLWQRAVFANRTDHCTDHTVAGLCAAYIQYCREYYHGDKQPVGVAQNSLSLLIELYGTMGAEDFGPQELKAVRSALIECPVRRCESKDAKKLTRTTVNR